jgi:YVTN family beta-propeller protein
MDLLRRAVVATIACSWLFLSGCGGTYRPIASILPLAAGNPQLADTVAVFNVNPNTASVSDATGSLSVFNVNGDSNVGNFSIGANDLLATVPPPQIPPTSRLITFAGGNSFIASADTQGHAVTVVDTLELTNRKASLPPDLVPSFITATATTGKILVSMQATPGSTTCPGGNGAIGIIDAITATLTNTICVGAAAPGFIVVAQNDAKAFILDTVDNNVSVLNIAAATLSAMPPLGVGNPVWATTSPDGNTVYVLNQGSISVINAVAETVTGSITAVAAGLSNPSVIIADNSNRLYVSNKNPVGTVTVLNASTLAAVHAPITVGAKPVALSVTPDGSSVYVANTGSNFASVINANSFNVSTLTPIPATVDPTATVQSVTVSKDGTKAFMAVTVNGDRANAAGTSGNGVYVVFTSNNAFVTNPSGSVLNVAPPQDMSCDATESCSGVLLQRPVQIVPRI